MCNGNLEYEPIVFMNSPISDESNDVIGINSAVQSIKKATNEGATMVGVIADYGSGKSSLTEILSSDKETYGKSIYINMWDSLTDNTGTPNNTVEVNSLKKSFVYQLATGISEHCAQYVNRRLNKNFGILSFSVNSWGFWGCAIPAALMYFIFSALSLLKIEDIEKALAPLIGKFEESTISTFSVCAKASAPFFLILGIVLAIIGLRKTSIAFSHWKTENRRETDVNDIFEVYSFLYKKLQKSKRKRLIIVEDLDRISNKEIVINFIKEIYRFNSLSAKKPQKRPVFIISIKPEYKLVDSDDGNLSEYSKLFDFTVSLKPIHYQDYSELLFEIIGDKNSRNRILLQKYLEEECEENITDSSLPKSFNWIVTGRNLTIRQLKDRLNDAVSLFVTLKNKGYKNKSYISFSSCAAVVYLEHQYPKCFPELVNKEDLISDLVRDVYLINNLKNGCVKDVEKLISQKISSYNKTISENEDFIKDLSKMFFDGDISDNFRIYFYSFPKNSYIKNADEKDVSNLLLNPYKFMDYSRLEEKINHIILNKTEDLITDDLKKISDEDDIKMFPKVIFENSYLLSKSYEVNPHKVFASIRFFASWENIKFEDSIDIISKVFSYKTIASENVIKHYVAWLEKEFYRKTFIERKREDIRKELLKIFGDDIIKFKHLFFVKKSLFEIEETDSLTKPIIISQEELLQIKSKEIALDLINADLINDDNVIYILEFLNENNQDVSLFDKKIDLIISISEKVSSSLCWNKVVEFLMINRYVDDRLFEYVVSGITDSVEDKTVISDYLSSLSLEQFTPKYAQIIDKNIIDIGLSDNVLSVLYSEKCFSALLSFLSKEDRLDYIDFTNEELSSDVLTAFEVMLSYEPDNIILIRYELVKQAVRNDSFDLVLDNYIDLFFGSYPLITDNEMSLLETSVDIVRLLDRSKITADNFENVVSHINLRGSSDNCYKLFELLFGKRDDNYTDNTIAINIINNLNYEEFKFSLLQDEERQKILAYIKRYYDLTNWTNAIEFMEKTNCLIPELERIVVGSKKDYYIDLINYVDNPSSFTMKWLLENNITFAVSKNTCLKLLESSQYQKYFVGSVMRTKTFVFPYPDVPNEVVFKEYNCQSCLWNYLIDNIEFLNYIIENRLYEKIPKNSDFTKNIKPLYKGKQTVEFTQFVLDNVSSRDEKIRYLCSVRSFDETSRDKISNLLLQSKYKELISEDAVFEKFNNALWSSTGKSARGFKGSFTKKRNKLLKK